MSKLEQALRELIDASATVISSEGVGGGCISEAARVRIRRGDGQSSEWFVKTNEATFLDNFQAEIDGLNRLSESSTIRVPTEIAVGAVGGSAWLVTEWIDQAPRPSEFFVGFGRDLARMHQATSGAEIGLDRDNYLGSAPQPNAPRDRWSEFFADQRIGFQLRWAVDQQLADSSLREGCQQIVDSMDRLLDGRDEQTSLLHGDLWSGNYLCDAAGRATIIDPAAYYGCREAEFGMLRLFGSCPDSFYDAYQDTFPLPGGWQRRVSVYVLYHLLNHLNLFGSGYLDQCRTVTAQILRA